MSQLLGDDDGGYSSIIIGIVLSRLIIDGRWLFGVRFGLGDSVTATFCALVDDVPDARARADVARHVATTALHSPEAADARDASQPPDGARASGPSQAREV